MISGAGMDWWRRARLREPVALVALLGFVALSLLPAGYMPASGGGFALQLCNAAQFDQERRGAGGEPVQRDSHSASFCDYALAPVLGAPPAATAPQPCNRRLQDGGRRARYLTPTLTADRHRNQAPRAPPELS
jgi:hypothetical protein